MTSYQYMRRAPKNIAFSAVSRPCNTSPSLLIASNHFGANAVSGVQWYSIQLYVKLPVIVVCRKREIAYAHTVADSTGTSGVISRGKPNQSQLEYAATVRTYVLRLTHQTNPYAPLMQPNHLYPCLTQVSTA